MFVLKNSFSFSEDFFKALQKISSKAFRMIGQEAFF
jgi:hypothetical protein